MLCRRNYWIFRRNFLESKIRPYYRLRIRSKQWKGKARILELEPKI